MAEKEYIEREAAIELCRKHSEATFNLTGEPVLIIKPDYVSVLRSIPAADVVEVRHGRWERVDYGNGLYNYHCSSCRHIPRENIRSNYCPNCGADMRAEEGE